MARDLEGLADVVVLTVKNAMSPHQADVAVLRERLTSFDARIAAVESLRDRIVTVETKALQPVIEKDIDLTPVLERLAALEARLASTGDLRDRVVAIETKAAAPVEKNGDLAPVLQQLAAAELRLKALETTPVLASVTDLTKDVMMLRERMAVVETRAPIPGPPGEPGTPGKDGAPGRNGIDGRDGLAGLSFEGVYQEGKSYDKGHLVTWGGSSWHCNEPTTTKPGDGSKAWTLMVKRGRDGKDGRDAETMPVIRVNP